MNSSRRLLIHLFLCTGMAHDEIIALAVVVALGIMGTFVVPGPDKALHRVLVWTSVVCVYLFWLMVYQSQKYPLLYPVDTRYSEASNSTRDWAAQLWNNATHKADT